MQPRLILSILLCFIPLAAGPTLAATTAWDEGQVVDAFLTGSRQVAAARLAVRAAEAEVVAASILQNPTVDVGREQVFSSGGPAEQHRLGVQVPWTIAGKRELRQAIARAGVAVAQARAEYQVFLMTQDVRAAFAQATVGDAQVRLLVEHQETLGRLVQIAEARKKSGESSGYDTMRLRLAMASLQAQVIRTRADAKEARARLAGLLGQAVDGELRQAPPVIIPSAVTLIDKAIACRPDLIALRAERDRAQQVVRLADRGRWPDPAVAFGLKQTNEPTVQGFGYTAGLAWPMPVLNRGQAELARAEADLARLDAQLEALTARIQAETPVGRAALAERLDAAEQLERQSTASVPPMLRIAELAYKEGEHGVDALLNAHQAALEVRLQRLDLLSAARLAQLDLERLVGARLTDR